MSTAPQWKRREVERLVELAGRFKSRNWADIAALMPGRTAGACMQAYYAALARQRRNAIRDQIKAAIATRSPHEAARVIMAPRPPLPEKAILRPRAGFVATSTLIIDAELRGRIAEQGLTAGLLGDPPAGRSALDLKRAGEGL